MKLNRKAYVKQLEDGGYKIKAGFEFDGKRVEVEAESLSEARDKFENEVFKYGLHKDAFQFAPTVDFEQIE